MVLGIRSVRKVYSMKEIAERIRPVAEEFELEAVYIFGSYAKGTARPDSDVDILVSAEKVQGIRIGGLYLAFRDALGKDISLVTEKADPRFLSIIRKDAVKVYGD